jgi:hypothetical protein
MFDDERRFGGDLVRRVWHLRARRFVELRGRGRDLGPTTATNSSITGDSSRGLRRGGRDRGGATSTRRRRWRRLLFGASALLTLPTRANAGDLVVGEQTQMTANGDVHLTKKRHYLVRGDSEFTSHVMYAKLAQAPLLRIISDTRPNELANATGELRIDNAHSGRLFTSHRSSQLRRRRTLNELNTACPEQRHDLLFAIRRRVIRNHGEF